MMTTKNIIKEPEKKSEPKKEAAAPSPATSGYLSPAQAAAKEARETSPRNIIEPPVEDETTNQRLLRVIRTARERLRGRGMPELDIELDELIEEIKGWGEK